MRLSKTYSKESAFAIAHKSMHEIIKPAFLKLLDTYKVVGMIYETLILPSNLVCEEHIVFEVAVRSS